MDLLPSHVPDFLSCINFFCQIAELLTPISALCSASFHNHELFLTPVYYSDSSFCKSKFKILKGLEALKCHFLQSLMLEKGKRNILLKYLIHFFNDMRTATKSSSSKTLCKDQCKMPPIADCRSQYSK